MTTAGKGEIASSGLSHESISKSRGAVINPWKKIHLLIIKKRLIESERRKRNDKEMITDSKMSDLLLAVSITYISFTIIKTSFKKSLNDGHKKEIKEKELQNDQEMERERESLEREFEERPMVRPGR